jgi:uncharacterized surface protein with fasciclin (FAS1) repeats
MKTHFYILLFAVTAFVFNSCGSSEPKSEAAENTNTSEANTSHGQSGVNDEFSKPDVVKVAIGSKDHTTLVAAVKAAELVDVLSNSGPFTVFAPVNAAFDALPAGTVEGLLKPEKKADLQNILQYHVFVGGLKAEDLKDGQLLNMVNGDNAKITVKDGKVQINGANIIGSVTASNGIVHVIDAVMLPPAKK